MFLSRYIFIYAIFLLIDFKERGEAEREGERKTSTLLFHVFMHSLVASGMCPDQRSGFNLSILGRHSSPRSYPARACHLCYVLWHFTVQLFHKFLSQIPNVRFLTFFSLLEAIQAWCDNPMGSAHFQLPMSPSHFLNQQSFSPCGGCSVSSGRFA